MCSLEFDHECPGGNYYSISDSRCLPCELGTYREEGASNFYECRVCPAGQFADVTEASSCSLCSGDWASPELKLTWPQLVISLH